MRNCSVPGYPTASLGPWQAAASPGLVVADACGSGGGVGFRLSSASALDPGFVGTFTFVMPLTGPQRDISLEKISLWYAARLLGSGTLMSIVSIVMRRDGRTGEGGNIAGPPGGENLNFGAQFNPGEMASYGVYLTCGSFGSIDPHSERCVPDHAVPLEVRGAEVTLSEQLPPTVAASGGTLLAGGPQQGVRTVSYSAGDPQSGLAKVEVLLGDSVVKAHDLAPQCARSDFTVCPTSDERTLEIQTRDVPNGSYDLTIRATDAAGNQQIVHGEHAVEVANQTPPAATATGSQYAIATNFKGTSRRTLTVPYGKRVTLRGRLTHASGGAGVSGPVQILERLDRRGAREKLARTITTKADGSFSVGVRTSGPSRAIRVAYHPAGGAQVASRALKIRVVSAARLRATLRGRLVRFSGRVLSGPIPKGGKRVQMEGRSPGSAWTRFKSLRTDRKGGFSGTYRLRVRRPGVLLKVRAVVPTESSYGYLASRSRAVSLRVR
jgi:hypothetical protein